MTNPRYLRDGVDFARGRLIEECGELQAALGKSIRWGWKSVNPELPKDKQETNMAWIIREIQDVREAINNLEHKLMEDPPKKIKSKWFSYVVGCRVKIQAG